jgi:hypothetical protein
VEGGGLQHRQGFVMEYPFWVESGNVMGNLVSTSPLGPRPVRTHSHTFGPRRPTSPDHEVLVTLNSKWEAVSFALYQHNASLHQDTAPSDPTPSAREIKNIYRTFKMLSVSPFKERRRDPPIPFCRSTPPPAEAPRVFHGVH